MSNIYHISLEHLSLDQVNDLFAPQEKNLDVLRSFYHVEIIYRNNELLVMSDDERKLRQIEDVIAYLVSCIQNKQSVGESEILFASSLATHQRLDKLQQLHKEMIAKTVNGKPIYPKTLGQAYLYKCMKEKDITFALGVAGTGKTYLSVMYAASLLKKGEINKIILTRPAVEAGETLGFLPGDLKEKVDPYLRPLYDALHDALGVEMTEKLMEKEVIEIAPLAYMRGRTLENAFIILDEAQNSTRAQLKMFLTRMGYHSKIIVTGDITQIDLIKKKDSGLLTSREILGKIPGIAFVELTSLDVVRHPLVQKIIEAYEAYENEQA
ncbi:MAG: PhoH family protein [Erysipelotrichia bacterium]|nr:PhoH family protein [Erysipelotrichia bacterium]